jgi:acyl carrier protein
MDDIQILRKLFAAALSLEYVAPDTDFFLAGGHSLSALTLAMAAEDALGVHITTRDVFECPSPELLAQRLGPLRQSVHPPGKP